MTNTYFEGRKKGSQLAKFGRSKEKRSDCKIVVLALVINPEGFIKYSSIFEGNMQDSKTLEEIVMNLRSQTSTTKRAVVVMDAGIATEENLEMLIENDFDYVCVSRSKLKDYRIDPSCCPVEIEDKKKQKIQLQKVISEKHNDYFLKIDSEPNSVERNNPYNEHAEIGFDGFSKLLREVILSRRCSEPTLKVAAIYRRLKYKPQPFTKRKFVVHKSEFQKMELADLQRFLI